ncbi:hypothetical protein PsorP6_000528 [Peronosclerospora sorghi]|uniref:Uncharacterized protein n=1 Tax=Peronosclerospora sorghi TaxID=230839 RepID=A0ACC0WVX7_9STRA|nr:hypothetical protein PsorP6_000528 [Peronosclerospora sorghi]
MQQWNGLRFLAPMRLQASYTHPLFPREHSNRNKRGRCYERGKCRYRYLIAACYIPSRHQCCRDSRDEAATMLPHRLGSHLDLVWTRAARSATDTMEARRAANCAAVTASSYLTVMFKILTTAMGTILIAVSARDGVSCFCLRQSIGSLRCPQITVSLNLRAYGSRCQSNGLGAGNHFTSDVKSSCAEDTYHCCATHERIISRKQNFRVILRVCYRMLLIIRNFSVDPYFLSRIHKMSVRIKCFEDLSELATPVLDHLRRNTLHLSRWCSRSRVKL